MNSPSEVTRLLLRLQSGDKEAHRELTPLVYGELRRLAAGLLRRERPGHTLQPTALVHEAYLKLADQTVVNWHSRAHFLHVAVGAMRQILVDHARRRQAGKRGAGVQRITLDEALVYSDDRAAELIALDDALNALSEVDVRMTELVEMRYFGGLKGEEMAEALGISTATVTRKLRLAQAWLCREMRGERHAADCV